jgi:hydrogenase-4 component E
VSPAVDLLLVIFMLFNFLMLGQGRLRSVILCAAAQGGIVGVLLVIAHGRVDLRGVLVALVLFSLKAVVIPGMLLRALKDAGIRREVEPMVSFVTSLLLAALGTGLAILFAGTLPLAPEHAHGLIVPASLATVLTGFLMLTTRKKALNQVVGYLTLENGVFIFGLTLLDAMPFMVEIGVLLDLVVSIFVMGIVIDRINREFSSIDTENLNQLRD